MVLAAQRSRAEDVVIYVAGAIEQRGLRPGDHMGTGPICVMRPASRRPLSTRQSGCCRNGDGLCFDLARLREAVEPAFGAVPGDAVTLRAGTSRGQFLPVQARTSMLPARSGRTWRPNYRLNR